MANCALCGEPLPLGEKMFKYHGYSGPCPKPPLPQPTTEVVSELDDAITSIIRDVAELPDRTSPSDDPETMLVRESELRDILWRHLDGWGRTR